MKQICMKLSKGMNLLPFEKEVLRNSVILMEDESLLSIMLGKLTFSNRVEVTSNSKDKAI